MTDTRAEIQSSIAATQAALDRLTPAQLEVVQAKVIAEMEEWWRAELAKIGKDER